MKVLLETKALKAALQCSAVKDIRFYLNGVFIELSNKPKAVIVGTDGHILFAGQSTCEGHDGSKFSLIIPTDAVKGAIKVKSNLVELATSGLDFSIGNYIFKPVDGRFPDWRKIIPAKVDGTPAQYQPELLTRARNAMQYYHGNRDNYRFTQNGSGPAVYNGPSFDCIALVMPVRPDKTIGDYSGIGF